MIAFMTEGGNKIGMGHFLRCFGIADKLMELGEDVCYIIPPDADKSFPESKGFKIYVLDPVEGAVWNTDEAIEILLKSGADTVIADSYRLSKEDFAQVRNVCRLIYLDDLDTYDCNADAVINFNPGADAAKYLQFDVPGRSVYAGVEYYPLRREFEGKRKTFISADVKRVLLTSGSTDPEECILQILNGIEPAFYSRIEFEILTGMYFSDDYKDRLKTFCKTNTNVKMLPWGDRVSDVLAEADLLITPGSSMVMEGLSLNVPCITYEFVDNHHETVKWLDELEMTAAFGKLGKEIAADNIRSIFDKELDPDVRIKRSETYSKSFDGKGLDRVADIIRKRSV